MPFVTTQDGTQIFYKDWGTATDRVPPRLAALGRRLGRPDDVLRVTRFPRHRARPARSRTLDAKPITGTRWTPTRPTSSAVAHLDLEMRYMSATRPAAVKLRATSRDTAARPRCESRAARRGTTDHGEVRKNPGGLPLEVFDGFRAALAANRAQFYLDVPTGPFYGFNRPGAKVSQGLIDNWWRQGMMGGAKAAYDCIKAFSETDFTEDLKKIEIPVLVIHGDDDQIVPYADAGPLSAKLLKNGTLKTYKGTPHGMLTTHADIINPDLLAFIQA